jgi:mono/diheme cytochrome c family protein
MVVRRKNDECRWLRLYALVFGAAIWAAADASAWSQEKWDCPAEASLLANPVAVTPDTIALGRRNAVESCAECHGEFGMGNGPAAATLRPQPASWRSPEFQAQSDGCIFWKLTHGRGAMPPAKAMPEVDRWHIVNFIRSLGPERIRR